MGGHPVQVDIDPREMARAQDMWEGFTHLMKYGVIGVIVVLAGMAIFLL